MNDATKSTPPEQAKPVQLDYTGENLPINDETKAVLKHLATDNSRYLEKSKELETELAKAHAREEVWEKAFRLGVSLACAAAVTKI